MVTVGWRCCSHSRWKVLCWGGAQFVSIEQQMLWFCGWKKKSISTELWWWDGHPYTKYPKKTWLTLTKMILSTGYCEWRPAGTHHRLRRGQRPRWRDAPPVSSSRQTSEKMPCAVSRLALVCVSLCPYCQLMHLSMHHFCLSVCLAAW